MTKIGKKRLLSVLLAVAMVVTFVPVLGMQTAYAAEPAGTYARYDSSDNSLTFFTSTEVYTNGQVDGTMTYYADFIDTEFEYGYLPWDAIKEDVKTVTFEDVISPVSTRSWFDTFKKLEKINNIGNLDTSNVTSMRSMFYDCSSLKSLDLSTFDTSKVKTMLSMFRGCTSFTSLDLSGFDTSNVEDMSNMFSQCEGLTSLKLTGFSTVKVTTMKSMFYNCFVLPSVNLSSFDTSHVTTMADMFEGCKSLKNLDLSGFVTSEVTDMSYMFCHAESLKRMDLTTFDTSKVTNMKCMFAKASELELVDLSSFNVSAVSDMVQMFNDCSKLSVIIVDSTIWDASGVDNEHSKSMFFGAVSLPGYENVAASLDASKAVVVEAGGYLMSKPVSIEGATVTEITDKTYTGKALTQLPVVQVYGRTLELGTDYTVSYKNNTNVGIASLIITGKGVYSGSVTKLFKINKAPNPLTMKGKTATVKYKKLKKKTQTLAVTKVIKFTKDAKDKKTYTLSSAKKGKKSFKKYFKINKTTGKVTVKKGLKKGTYKVKVKVKAAGNANYKPSAVKTVTFTVKVK